MTVKDGVKDVDSLDIEESYLALPSSVERVGDVRLSLYDDALSCPGVREFGSVELTYASFHFPENVEKIGSITIQASEAHLPSSLRILGDISVHDENRESADDEPARTLHWQEGPIEIGAVVLGPRVRMNLPSSIQTIASASLSAGAYLELDERTVILGSCELGEHAKIERTAR